jgi:hypothetical protein
VTGSYFSSGLDPRGLLDPGWEKIGIVKFIWFSSHLIDSVSIICILISPHKVLAWNLLIQHSCCSQTLTAVSDRQNSQDSCIFKVFSWISHWCQNFLAFTKESPRSVVNFGSVKVFIENQSSVSL